MSQDVFDTINASTTSGTQLATILGAFKDAVISGFKGTSRPTEIDPGGYWIDNSLEASPNFLWSVKVWTGTQDVTVFKINLSSGTASVTGTDQQFTVTRVSGDTLGPVLQFVKNRLTGNGQVLTGDVVGEIDFLGRTDSSGNPLVCRIRSIAADNMTTATTGADLVFETTASATASLIEVMRLTGRRLGLGTSSPQSTLHVKGLTGIMHERSSDDAIGSRFNLKKSRASGAGQVQSGDVVGTLDFSSTDAVAADFIASEIQSIATENHTASVRGAKLVIRNVSKGGTVLVDQVQVDENGVQIITPMKVNAEVIATQSIASSAGIAQLAADKKLTLLTGSTATTLRGVNSAGLSKVVVIHNSSSANLTVTHLDAGAVLADRIKLPSGRNITVSPDNSISLFYSPTENYWKLYGGGGSGLGDYITTKGDLIVGDVNGFPSRLAVPTTPGQALVSDPTSSTGYKFATPAAGSGKNYVSSLYDGTSLQGINTFNGNITLTLNNPAVDTVGYAITANAHGLGTGQPVVYTTTGTAIGGLSSGTTYYAVWTSANSFGLATTQANANAKVLIPLTAAGTGSQVFTASGVGAIGTGGTVTGLTTALNTTTQLRGTSNIRFSKDAVNRQGQGWSVDLTFDRADYEGGKLCAIKMTDKTSALYASGDLQVSVYDVANNIQVQVDTVYGSPITASSLTTGFTSYFYTNSNSSLYRVIFTIATTNASAWDFDFVDFTVGVPVGMVPGAIITPWTLDGTITIGGTTTAPSKGTTTLDRVWWRRVGENLQARYEYSQSTVGASAGSGDYLIALPASLQADLTRTTPYSTPVGASAPYSPTNHIGTATIRASSTNHIAGATCTLYDATRFRIGGIGVNYAGSTSINGGMFSAGLYGFNQAPITFGIQIELPIAGWSAGAVYSTSDLILKNIPNTVVSAVKTPPASGVYLAFSGNAITLVPGQYDVTGAMDWNFVTGGALYGQCVTLFSAANGNDTATVPAALSTLSGLTVRGLSYSSCVFNSQINFYTQTVTINVTVTQTTTIYLNGYQTMGTPANGRVTAYIVAVKRPDYSVFGVYGTVDIRSVTSAVYAPSGSNVWHPLTNNFIDLPVGTWRVTPSSAFADIGTAASYSVVGAGLFAANGANSLTIPSLISTLANVDMLSAQPSNVVGPAVPNQNLQLGPAVIIRVKSGTARIYANAFSIQTTSANARVTTYMTAERLQ